MASAQLRFVRTGSDVLEDAAGGAHERGVDAGTVAYGLEATARRFTEFLRRDVTDQEASRIEAYFAGVLRRSTMRSRGSTLRELRTRLVIETLADDLMCNGFPPERIVEELSEMYGEVPVDVLTRLQVQRSA